MGRIRLVVLLFVWSIWIEKAQAQDCDHTTFVKFTNQRTIESQRVVVNARIATEKQCTNRCRGTPSCIAVDYQEWREATTDFRCYTVTGITTYEVQTTPQVPALGYNHYKLVDCSATNCDPMTFVQFSNQRTIESQRQVVNARIVTVDQCTSRCRGIPGCVAFDYQDGLVAIDFRCYVVVGITKDEVQTSPQSPALGYNHYRLIDCRATTGASITTMTPSTTTRRSSVAGASITTMSRSTATTPANFIDTACEVPKSLDIRLNILIKPQKYRENEEIYFQCDRGYVLHGPESRTCNIDIFGLPYWSGYNPECSIVLCCDPGIPKNCRRQGNTFTYGSFVTYEPENGYQLFGSSRLECSESGTWIGTRPQCITNSCDPLPVMINGYASSTERTHGTIVRVFCNADHTLSGNDRLMCGFDSRWHGSLPTCIRDLQGTSTPGIPQCRQLTLRDSPKGGYLLCLDFPNKQSACQLFCYLDFARINANLTEVIHCGPDTDYVWSHELTPYNKTLPFCAVNSVLSEIGAFINPACGTPADQASINTFVKILIERKLCPSQCTVVNSKIVCGEIVLIPSG